MKPYPSYKDSGMEWVGKIPSDWVSTVLKYIGFLYGGLSGKSGKDFNDDDNPNNKLYIPFTNICDNTYISLDNLGKVYISGNDRQNTVKKFDIFFLMSSEDQEGIGKSSVLKDDFDEVYLNTFCRGYRITDEEYDSFFINYLLSGHTYRELLRIEGMGFTRINLRSHKVNDFKVLCPPLPEQKQIASFLDTKTKRIDELIEKTKKKIELLKEKRTALINHCVTKGLNPNVETKDSGVEWIGKIPSSWKVAKLKWLCPHITDGSHFSPDTTDEGKHYITVSDVTKNNDIDFKNCRKISDNSFDKLQRDGCQPEIGDVLITKDGTIGRGLVVERNDFVILSSIGLIRTDNKKVNPYYLLYYLLSGICIDQMYSNIRGAGITRLTINLIKDLTGIIPPLLEQKQIIEYLDEKTQKIDTTIERETKRIELLKEYRRSLISEVVTGKIDVRDEEVV